MMPAVSTVLATPAAGACRVRPARPHLHVPPEAPAPRPCGRCGTPADDLLFDGRRHLCEPCFDGLLAALRNLPPMGPALFDAYLADLHREGC